jgi:hypothetical protein
VAARVIHGRQGCWTSCLGNEGDDPSRCGAGSRERQGRQHWDPGNAISWHGAARVWLLLCPDERRTGARGSLTSAASRAKRVRFLRVILGADNVSYVSLRVGTAASYPGLSPQPDHDRLRRPLKRVAFSAPHRAISRDRFAGILRSGGTWPSCRG